MPKYIIHIGPHKTGTSYLQTAFRTLHAELLARGIYYPHEWGTLLGHYGLVERLRGPDSATLAQDFERLSQSKYEKILISAEDLSLLSADQLRQFRSFIGDAETQIVFYCRRWSEVLPSGWRELVKQGVVETFPEFMSRMMLNPHRNPSVNFSIKLAPYARLFGADSLRLVSYNDVVERRQDLFVHFCQTFLDWDQAPSPGLGRLNESLGPVETEMIRILNALRASSGDPTKPFSRFMELKAQLPIEPITAAMQRAVCTMRIRDHAPVLANIHNVMMSRFAAGRVRPHYRDGLFRPIVQDVPYVCQDYLLQAGIPRAIKEINRALAPAIEQPLPVA